ncbi:hypothetical protein [Microlunatus flavus]|uniref:Lipoprotein n=1 Tax=Microlunatus flavus TaxID=1036181 RepID=A0A1H8ZF80_9ACTN|nr:hypothetical protein [Microlunatus flavus]SEP63066.1 hypothetical protein SAMN05421756_101221 [Microlunatus flavus]
MVIVVRAGLLVAGAAALLATACSATPEPAQTPGPTVTFESPTPSETASAGACPDGSYRVTGLEGRGEAAAIGKGTGGDIDADFTDGTFTISSDGAQPVTVDIGPTNAQLRFDGTISGTYAGEPSALRLTTKSADGDVSIKGFGFTRTRSASELAGQLLGKGVTAQVTCDDAAGTAAVTLPNASLTLKKS